MLENPIPSSLESAMPCPTHVVMVSGTVDGSLPCPSVLREEADGRSLCMYVYVYYIYNNLALTSYNYS